MSLRADDVARLEIGDIGADFDDFPYEFVADGQRNFYGPLRPGVPFVDVKIRAADTGAIDANQHVVDADAWLLDIFQP